MAGFLPYQLNLKSMMTVLYNAHSHCDATCITICWCPLTLCQYNYTSVPISITYVKEGDSRWPPGGRRGVGLWSLG